MKAKYALYWFLFFVFVFGAICFSLGFFAGRASITQVVAGQISVQTTNTSEHILDSSTIFRSHTSGYAIKDASITFNFPRGYYFDITIYVAPSSTESFPTSTNAGAVNSLKL